MPLNSRVQHQAGGATGGLSTEESTTADSAAPAGKAFLREDALPMRNGGGVAFPQGAFGRAFYLDEWEFIRYCTVQGERHHLEQLEAKRDSRLKDLKTLAA